ncbi:hypothetical protein [Absidia glauca]|uniref:Uncharacterized protein n=1 Tax=Absidia glauca TaxID=4829 RepID=A0A163J1U4_ABSGL|nr:hypothetical protein [Absidia glauca]
MQVSNIKVLLLLLLFIIPFLKLKRSLGASTIETQSLSKRKKRGNTATVDSPPERQQQCLPVAEDLAPLQTVAPDTKDSSPMAPARKTRPTSSRHSKQRSSSHPPSTSTTSANGTAAHPPPSTTTAQTIPPNTIAESSRTQQQDAYSHTKPISSTSSSTRNSKNKGSNSNKNKGSTSNSTSTSTSNSISNMKTPILPWQQAAYGRPHQLRQGLIHHRSSTIQNVTCSRYDWAQKGI